ncbi:putative uncharacterized protein C8orf31 [Plecturocebus cupreus]
MAEKPYQNSCNSVMHLSRTEEPGQRGGLPERSRKGPQSRAQRKIDPRLSRSSTHRAQGLMATRTAALQRSSLQQEILEFMKMLRNFHTFTFWEIQTLSRKGHKVTLQESPSKTAQRL